MAKQDTSNDHYEEFKLEHVKNEAPFEIHGRCFKCTYWQTLENGFPNKEQNVRGIIGEHLGECRRRTPLWNNNRTEWPVTYDFDWCGEFDAKAGKGGLAF
ncbi:MAG: hypothetical protein JW912_06185 [Sedimentisphaerales bacterium]|nr:hypothetical protein [Sedimentisphaerales bacterium]